MSINRFIHIFSSRLPSTGQPAVYCTVVVSAGTLTWGAYIAGRKVKDARAYSGDMSAVTGDAPVVREARFRVYDMDEHLSNIVN